MFERSLIAAVLMLGLLPLHAAAQDWRDVTSFRQRSNETALDVNVSYGAGELFIAPGESGELYRVGIRYDSEVFEPVTKFSNGRLEVGVEGTGNGVKLRKTKGGDMRLRLSPEVPLELDLHFGAVEADLELGGLHLARVDIETGASDTHVRFSEPNRMACERLEISMGAAAFEAEGLGNARCASVRVEGGVGDLTLDFSGAWSGDVRADVTIALGSVTLIVPENVGVRVDKDTFLADFSGSRFEKRDGLRYSDNWETAEHRLTIDLEGAFGSFDVRWAGPTVVTP